MIKELVEKIIIERNKVIEDVIWLEIQEIVKENEVETKIVINEKAVVNALNKQMPKKPEYYGDGYSEGKLVYDYAKCPVCGRNDFEYDINNWGCNYCPDCGQALDWSDV